MGYFHVRYASRVLIYERKMFIGLATEAEEGNNVHLYQLMETYASSFFSDMEVRTPHYPPHTNLLDCPL